jgi:hypothetical protein
VPGVQGGELQDQEGAEGALEEGGGGCGEGLTIPHMRFLLFSLTLFSTTLCAAKKMQMSIDAVILSADLIVVGEITRADSSAYFFRIDETLYARDTAWHVMETRVNAWKEWTCDWRNFKIVQGQRLLLLLRKSKHGFTPINGSTGEIPILNDSIVLRNEEKVHVPYESHPYQLSVQDFSAGVKALQHCCAHNGEIEGEYGYFDDSFWKCSQTERTAVLNKDDFTAWLFRRVEQRKQTR